MNVNTELMNILKDIGVPVSFLVCNTEERPHIYVTFFEVVAVEVEYADNVATTLETNVQVDIWATFGNSITTVKHNIINSMKKEGWILTKVGPDLYEKETNILHKALDFKKESEVI